LPEPGDSLTVEARLENLARIRRFVEEACRRAGIDESACFDLKLAVDEACTNIVEHGYAGAAGSIALRADADAEGVRVTIRDRGAGFDPSRVRAADVTSPCEERPIGGLGWHLIRSSVDEVDYDRDPAGGNRLTLVKRSRPWRSE
jgi:serine/threonine-protein kinase RsbW